MYPLVFTAGKGVVDKDTLKERFQVAHQQVMHYTVPEVSGKYFP